MSGFLAAHGYQPGPTQRPLLAGALSGLLATIPAIALLHLLGSLDVESRILGLSLTLTIAAGCITMTIAGAAYARLFGRAANDMYGGWLFGMMFGFTLWAGGAVMVLPLLSDGRAPAGVPAIGIVVSLLAWGAATGALQPVVQRLFHERIEEGAKHSEIGPSAATAKERTENPR